MRVRTPRRETALANLATIVDLPKHRSGNRLPAERNLSTQLNVSRSALRETLDVHEERGNIWRRAGKGIVLGQRPVGHLPNLNLITTRTSPSEVLEFRLLIEPRLARLAALRSTETEIEHMKRLLESSEEARDAESWELWDSRLHRAVAQAAHNTLMLSIFDAVNAIRGQVKWGNLRHATFNPVRHAAYCAHHRGFVDAIGSRDPIRSEMLMRKHLETVRDGIIGADRGDAEQPQGQYEHE